MKLEQLEYFVETARREHIGQAANSLHISPSAISHSIAALEAEFGQALFIKQGRQIKLTSPGKLLFARAQQLIADAKRIQWELTSQVKTLRGHYRIAATHVLSAQLLTPSWMQLRSNHPDLTATLYSLRSGEVLSQVQAGELDLGFCFCPHSSPFHHQHLIHRGQLVFCFDKHHPFLNNPDVTTLGQFPSIVAMAVKGIENCENHPDLAKINLQPKVIGMFDSYDIALCALKGSDVWTLLPDFLAAQYADEIGTFIPPDWDAQYSIEAVWPKNRICTQVVEYLIQYVSDHLEKRVQRQAM